MVPQPGKADTGLGDKPLPREEMKAGGMEEMSKGGCLVQTKMLIPLALLWVWRAAGCSRRGRDQET